MNGSGHHPFVLPWICLTPFNPNTMRVEVNAVCLNGLRRSQRDYHLEGDLVTLLVPDGGYECHVDFTVYPKEKADWKAILYGYQATIEARDREIASLKRGTNETAT